MIRLMTLGRVCGHVRRLAVLTTLLFAASSGLAIAQTYQVIKSFKPAPKGVNPYAALIQAGDGSFYGTTWAGGNSDDGTIFKLDAAGTLTTVHAFSGDDGSNPRAALIQASDGAFYGTTMFGGESDYGTVFKLDTAGTLTTLHSFDSFDGSYPTAALIEADGSFYGTTTGGGEYGEGTIFQMDATGRITTLHSFSYDDGAGPHAALIRASDGMFYGTTVSGGTSGAGTVFKLMLDEPSTLTTLHSFGGVDGANPYGALIQAADGSFYGTTSTGGTTSGRGTIFELDPLGTLTTLHSFTYNDGADPFAGLIQAADGKLYGTTVAGGDRVGENGTVFAIDLSGALTTLHTFASTDGAAPHAALIQAADGGFYGTTTGGGAASAGTVFKLETSGTLTTLNHFAGDDGANPHAALVQASDGSFYGTTLGGGLAGVGAIFRLTADDTLTILHSFTSDTGRHPYAPLIQAIDGSFYGTTSFGGTVDAGTVFKVDAAGTLSTVHSFTAADGINPYGALVEAADGSFYGTTRQAGPLGQGTIFKLDGAGTLTTIHAFTGGADGAYPYAALIQSGDGSFYGTTQGSAAGVGTVFRLDPSGTLTTLHRFTGGDGAYPYAALVEANDGSFYGTTSDGGASGYGTIFKIDVAGTLTTVHHFTGNADGATPYAGLMQASDGNLYGNTWEGGSGFGTVFRLDPAGSLTTVHSFSGSDGANPLGALIQASDGTLYGTTANGGEANAGVIFRVYLPPGTSTTLTASPNPSTAGQPVSLQAAITSSTGSPNEGMVEFFDGATSLGTATVSGGLAYRTVSTLAVGSHQLTARYQGTTSFAPSTSDPLTQVVEPPTYVLTVTLSGTGNGTVTSGDALIACPGDCTETYASGTDVTLSATPGTNSTFTGWSGACSGTGTCQVTMNANTAVTATFTATAPDLIESAITNPPARVLPGATFTMSDTVSNVGNLAAGASSTRYYLSLDTAKGGGDTLLAGARAVGAVPAGGTNAGSSSVTVPANTALGTYYLLACADDTSVVAEAIETNNCLASATTVIVGRPDLVETAVSNPPTTVNAGKTFSVGDAVANSGSVAAGASTTRFYLSADGVRDPGDTLLKGTRPVGALAPGATSSGTTIVTVPAAMAVGTYRVMACADDLSKVAELDEGNNCTASTGAVQITTPGRPRPR